MNPLEAQAYADMQAALLEEFPEIDEQTLADTLEGCSDFPEAVDRFVSKIQDLEAKAAVCSQRAAQMKDRETRFKEEVKRRKQRLTQILEQVFEGRDKKSMRLPSGTVGLRSVPPKAEGEGTEGLPAEFITVTMSKKPDKKAIKQALESGTVVPGYRLTNGGLTLSIRS